MAVVSRTLSTETSWFSVSMMLARYFPISAAHTTAVRSARGVRVGEIGGDHFGYVAVFIIFVKFFQTSVNRPKVVQTNTSRAPRSLICLATSSMLSPEDIMSSIITTVFSGDGISEKFMRYNGIFAVDDNGIISSLIKHAISTPRILESIRLWTWRLHRAYNHQVVIVYPKIRDTLQKGF